MIDTEVLGFSDLEMERIQAAAGLLPESQRASFLRSVGNRLASLPYQASIADVEIAIRFVLNAYGIAGGRRAQADRAGARPARTHQPGREARERREREAADAEQAAGSAVSRAIESNSVIWWETKE
jgi:hypothetical protein